MVKGGREGGGAELVFKTVTIFPLVIIQAFTHPANIRNRYTNITGRNQAILSRPSTVCLTSSGLSLSLGRLVSRKLFATVYYSITLQMKGR
jgi:hypothetical protein